MIKELNKINLQMFANDDINEVDNTENVGKDEEDLNNEDMDNKNNEDMDLLELLSKNEAYEKQFQSEVDRAIQKAIQTRDKKHQKELKIQEQRAKMTTEELQKEKERELQEKEQELHKYALKLQKIDYFKENDVPLELLDFVNVDNEEEIAEKTQAILSVVESLAQKEIKNSLQSNGYQAPKEEEKQAISLNDLSGLSLEEINSQWENLV